MHIGETTPISITDLWASVEEGVRQSEHMETAAQQLAEALHGRFGESAALARIFLTVPFGSLPSANQSFVRSLAESAGAGASLTASTPVLSLLGTYGDEESWRDRRSSQGHVGIPLISSKFVDGIPMISRLLKELGVPLEWVDSHDAEAIQKILGESESLFYVEDASAATDNQGRKIIAAQEFVSGYGIQSVFGIGGAYPGGELIVMVVFCRDRFPRERAENFLSLVTLLRGCTASVVASGAVFAEA